MLKLICVYQRERAFFIIQNGSAVTRSSLTIKKVPPTNVDGTLTVIKVSTGFEPARRY